MNEPAARSVPVSAPPALSAFLRGVERRAAVLAELQCGDAATGDAALGDCMRAFRGEAAGAAMGDWPRRFWTSLLAQPGLRGRTAVAIELDATDRLGALGAGPRAALLLHLAAGLDEGEAAAVLGVDAASYRLAVQRAAPQDATGAVDARAWQQLREQIHQRIKTLPARRQQQLAAAREHALEGPAVPGAAPGTAPAAAPRAWPRWLLPVLWALLVACLAGLAATFLLPGADGRGGGAEGTGVRELPLSAPKARFGEEAGLIAHRDFELLADVAGMAEAEDAGFHAWLAAHDGGRQLPPVDASGGIPATAVDAVAQEGRSEAVDTGSQTVELESAHDTF